MLPCPPQWLDSTAQKAGVAWPSPHVKDGDAFKLSRLQSEFCTNDFFRATNFLTKNAPKFSPKFLSLCSVGQKRSRKIPSKFPTEFSKFPCKKSKKNTDELLQERRKKIYI